MSYFTIVLFISICKTVEILSDATKFPQIYGPSRVEIVYEKQPKNLTCYVMNVGENAKASWYRRKSIEHDEKTFALISTNDSSFTQTTKYDGKDSLVMMLYIAQFTEDSDTVYKCEMEYKDVKIHFNIHLTVPQSTPQLFQYENRKGSKSEMLLPPGYDAIIACYAVADPRPESIVWTRNSFFDVRNSSKYSITCGVFHQHGINSTLKIARGKYELTDRYKCHVQQPTPLLWFAVIVAIPVGLLCFGMFAFVRRPCYK